MASHQAVKTRQEFLPEQAFRELPEPAPVGLAKSAKVIGYLRLCWIERRTLAVGALIGLALASLLAFVLPKQYQSAVQLMPPESQSGSGTMLAALSVKAGSGLGAVAGDLLGGNSSSALFIGILRSRTLEDRLVERFSLKRVYGVKLDEDALNRLANNTGISEDHKSGIISLSVVDHDPARAAEIAQGYVEELERLASELSTSAAHRERIFLEERLKVVQQELDRASGEFSRFASQNAAINIPEQGKAMVEAAAVLQGQLIAAESELKGLSEIYTPSNVRVRSLQARVSELRRQLEKLDGVKTSAPSKNSPEERLDYPTIRELPILGVTYADLLRRTKIQETVLETLTQQFELAKVEEAKDTPSVKVLDAANVPERKVFPPRLLIIFWGTLFGLGFSALCVEAGRWWRKLDCGDPRKILAYDMLQSLQACMPVVAPDESRVQASRYFWMRWVKLASPAPVQPPE